MSSILWETIQSLFERIDSSLFLGRKSSGIFMAVGCDMKGASISSAAQSQKAQPHPIE